VAGNSSSGCNWAEPFDARVWAVESAGGWGHHLAQQLLAAVEDVLDVLPATLAARARLMGSGRSNKSRRIGGTRTSAGRNSSAAES
jgi:transposase